jgi:MtN3 and saliva related transmembrane protein
MTSPDCSMNTMALEVLGLLAGAITSAGFLPQLIRGYQTKKLDDVSYFMPGVLAAGMTLWFLYGVMLQAIAIIVANLFGVCCCIVLIIMKKRYVV